VDTLPLAVSGLTVRISADPVVVVEPLAVMG
jgi:hypothetical protein